MRTLFTLLLCLSVASAANSNIISQQSRALTLPIIRSDAKSVFQHNLDSRGVESLGLANRSDIAYYARLEIGNPPQSQYVLLDTGSYELWVNPDCTALQNEQDQRFCQALGHYDASASSTAVSLGENKTLQYGIGSVTFDYYTETVGLGAGAPDAILQQLQFGVARKIKDGTSGILGLGYGKDLTIEYPNFIDQLFEQGVTQTKAFSIALGSKNNQEGIVMFGGVDAGKFSGSLQTLPIIPASESPDGSSRYWVELSAINLSSPGSAEVAEKTYDGSRDIAAFLDSGTTMTLLPTALARSIAADFGGSEPDADGHFEVDCASASSNGTLDFAFDGVTIRVPRSEMIREYGTGEGDRTCYLGIGASEKYALLGDSMLRSAYGTHETMLCPLRLHCDMMFRVLTIVCSLFAQSCLTKPTMPYTLPNTPTAAATKLKSRLVLTSARYPVTVVCQSLPDRSICTGTRRSTPVPLPRYKQCSRAGYWKPLPRTRGHVWTPLSTMLRPFT
ncbi:candidapepsin [Microdochium nivale]|nr:candidapepsin [Microdochium nivale]